MARYSIRQQDFSDLITIRPYVHCDGIPTFKDSEIAALFDKMQRDGTDKIVFYDGTVLNRGDFLKYMQSNTNLLIVALQDQAPVAFGWLNHFEHRTAQAHFCFFAEVWGEAVEIGKMLIEKAISIDGVDMLIGIVPDFNEGAKNFAVKCGAKVVGQMPCGAADSNGKSHPVTIVYYTR